LPNTSKSRAETKITTGEVLALAYNLVPGLENLSRVPDPPGRLDPGFRIIIRPELIWSFIFILVFGPIIAQTQGEIHQNHFIFNYFDSYN
jgi:hypothetical protein